RRLLPACRRRGEGAGARRHRDQVAPAEGRKAMNAEAATQQAPLPMTDALARLFRRLLEEMDTSESVEWDAGESTLDPAVYRDPSIHQREVERIFRRVPLCLGHADQLREPGSMIARDLFGLPLL